MKTVITASLAIAAVTACAEPTVVTWPDGVRSADLEGISAELPPVSLDQWHTLGGGQAAVSPGVFINDWFKPHENCESPPFEIDLIGYQNAPGATVDAAALGWVRALTCNEFDNNWQAVLVGDNDFSCSPFGDCPRDFQLIRSEGIYYASLRFDMADSIHYGWVAFELSTSVYPGCNICTDGPTPGELLVGEFNYIGFGYETTPDTAITVGGGLCKADLTLDAVLDLADIQAFVTAFTGQTGDGDLDGNGVYDLTDIQQFVTNFTTGCGLGI